MDSKLPYKIYSGIITQSGTSNPTINVLQNTTGGTVSIARSSTGVYFATLTGASFTSGKTFCLQNMGVFMGTLNTDTPFRIEFSYTTSNFTLYTNKTSTNTLTDGLLEGLYFEIRVYP